MTSAKKHHEIVPPRKVPDAKLSEALAAFVAKCREEREALRNQKPTVIRYADRRKGL